MRQWVATLAASMAALVAVPVGVELLIAYIKDENYSLPRAAAVLAGVLAGVVVLMALCTFAYRLGLLLKWLMLIIWCRHHGHRDACHRDGAERHSRSVRCCDLLSRSVDGSHRWILDLRGKTGADLFFAVLEQTKARSDMSSKTPATGCLLTAFCPGPCPG
jgi:type IV secretory pathway TrbD component